MANLKDGSFLLVAISDVITNDIGGEEGLTITNARNAKLIVAG